MKILTVFITFVFGIYYLNILSTSTTTVFAQENSSANIHLYPAIDGYQKIPINNLQLGIVLFLPQGETTSTIPNWKQNMETIYSQIKTFMESQFNNQLSLTYTIFTEPIQGDKNAEDYTFWDFPIESMTKNPEIDQWYHNDSGYRILIIYTHGQVRAANDSPPGYGVSIPGKTIVNPAFWLEDQLISGSNKYGIVRDGIIGSTQVLAFALGIPYPWDMPENINKDPNFGNIPGNIMGYSNSGLELSQTYFDDIVKQRMGLQTVSTNPTTTSEPVPIQYGGDANGDKKVNLLDFEILRSQFNTGGTNLNADFNNDGQVNLLDFSILKDNFGVSAPQP